MNITLKTMLVLTVSAISQSALAQYQVKIMADCSSVNSSNKYYSLCQLSVGSNTSDLGNYCQQYDSKYYQGCVMEDNKTHKTLLVCMDQNESWLCNAAKQGCPSSYQGYTTSPAMIFSTVSVGSTATITNGDFWDCCWHCYSDSQDSPTSMGDGRYKVVVRECSQASDYKTCVVLYEDWLCGKGYYEKYGRIPSTEDEIECVPCPSAGTCKGTSDTVPSDVTNCYLRSGLTNCTDDSGTFSVSGTCNYRY